MKKLFLSAILLASQLMAVTAQVNFVGLFADTNGVLKSPTNLFAANIGALTNELKVVGFGTGGGNVNSNSPVVFSQVGSTNPAATNQFAGFVATIYVLVTNAVYAEPSLGESGIWFGAHNFTGEDTFYSDPTYGIVLFGAAGHGGVIANAGSEVETRWFDNGGWLFNGSVTNASTLSVGGIISGNGVGVSNVVAASVGGSQSNIIASATTNYPNVLAFMAANTNLSTEAQSELNAYQRELALQGQLTNLIDLFPFNPRFNPGTNCLSLMGRTEYWSNIVMTTHGVSGVLGGRIVISNMPDLRTNTMVITWRFPGRLTGIAQYYLAGAVDPASGNSEWMYGGPWPACMITQGTTQPAASSGVWNEFMGASYSYNFWSPHQHFRHVSVLSSSNGVFQAWDNGVPCLITTSPTTVYNTGVTLANPLTNVWIFQAPGLQGGITGGMNGEVESVQVFKGAATSNLVVASWFAANELENENTWYTFITDSRGSPDENSTPYTNYPAFYMMNNATHYNQVCFDHFGVTGQQNYEYTNATEVYRITFLYAPHGRFTRENLHYSLNINDLYNGALTPAQIWPFYTLWSGYCLSNNVEMHVMTTSQISTNSYAGGFTYNATTEGYRETLNGMMMTNSFMFSRVDDLDGMISQFDVNTNNNESLEGLHFTGPMGWVKNQQIGQLMDLDYNQTPINFTNGLH
jgi:hypothetical protein